MDNGEGSKDEPLTNEQQHRVKKSKDRAFKIQQSRLTTHPYLKVRFREADSTENATIKVGAAKYKDTGGGFLLEDQPGSSDDPVVAVQEQPPIFQPERPACEICKKVFAKAWLFDKFDLKVCDKCKDPEMHNLITKTEAMHSYMLREYDLDRREPVLRYVSKRNPHNVRWGEMKLYLQLQVQKRAMEVWGSKERFDEEFRRREQRRICYQTHMYNKRMNELRRNIRSSLYEYPTSTTHTHEYGEETYNVEDDTYNHKCLSCGFEETFEKM